MSRAKNIRLTFLALCLFLMPGCIETFTFEVDSQESYIVVDGQFTANGKVNELYISTSSDYGTRSRNPVTGANAVLFGSGGSGMQYVETDPGRYIMDGELMRGIPGDSYHLEIDLANGTRILSEPAFMPYPTQLNSVEYQFETEYVETPSGNLFYQKVINIYVDASFGGIPEGNSAYLRWATDELYIFPEAFCGGLDPSLTCYVPIEGAKQQFSLFSSDNVTEQILPHQQVYKKTLFHRREFFGRHYFTVIQYSLTEEAYDYWSNVQDIANQRGSIFDIPPAALKGNLYYEESEDPVLGYFELAFTDTLRTFIFPFEYREQIDPTPYCSRINNTFLPECCSCFQIENATLEKPDWIP